MGQVDPYWFTLALITAAERMGAIVRSARVDGVERTSGSSSARVVGARVGAQVIEADAVVVAMGPWSAEAAAWLGVPVPVEPLRGQIVRLRPSSPLRSFAFGRAGNHAITKPGGLTFVGTTEERIGFDRDITEEARDAIRPCACDRSRPTAGRSSARFRA